METKTLERSLGLRHVTLYGLAFMAPITIFTIYGIAITHSEGMLPVSYIIALIVMLFTAYSYGQMVKEFPIAGSSYTFTQKGINPYVGFLVGWTIIIDYVLSPMISALLLSIMFKVFFPSVPAFVWITLFIITITVINILGIKIAANVNTILLFMQLLIFVIFIALSIKGLSEGLGAGSIFSTLPFFDPGVELVPMLAIVPLLCFTFLGFDAATALAEETKNPQKIMPKAIFIIVLSAGLLFIVTAYFLQLIYPDFHSFVDPEAAYIDILIYLGGNLLASIFSVVGITAAIASAIASGGSGARILYAMGRENVLPNKFFGYVSGRFRTPVRNIILIGVIAFSSLFLDIDTAIAFINYGALFAFTFVNFSVFFHFYVKQKKRDVKGTFLYLVLPLIGASLTGWFFLILDVRSLILGSSWLAVGFIYLAYKTKFFKQPPPQLDFNEQKDIEKTM